MSDKEIGELTDGGAAQSGDSVNVVRSGNSRRVALDSAASEPTSAFATSSLGTKADNALPATSYTASDVLTKVKTVDGDGSGLDADLLDGKHASEFATSAQGANADTAVQPARSVAAGTGLIGGGDLSAARTLSLDTSSIASLTKADSAEQTSEKGQPNGYAALDENGLIPSSQLPSYVDDVVEASDFASLPTTGDGGKIYVTTDTNKTYRWSGSAYVEIQASPGSTDSVTEGSTNLYFTAARVRSVVLPGLSLAPNAAIAATDTVLSALGKLQAQISALATVAKTGAYTDLSSKPTLGTAAAKDAGTGAGNLLLISTANKLPTLDGSALTNLPSSGAPGGASVGAYIFAYLPDTVLFGQTAAGSSLRYASVSGSGMYTTGTFVGSGTWKCQGEGVTAVTLWQRIA